MSALAVRLTPLMLFLAACEDSGNEGDDNLLTGVSGVIVVGLLLVIGLAVWRRRR